MKETKNRFNFIQTDKRVIERNLRSHLLTPAEHQKYLKSLQDEKDHWEEVPVSNDKGESNPS